MWKTVNSMYKSANKNLKKLSKNIPSVSSVSQSIQNIKIQKIISISKINSKKQTDVQKALLPILQNKKPIMPINKMSMIVQMSYQNDKFEEIIDLIFQKLRVFKYQSKYAKQTLNTLILLSYLLKNGASGFIDQFREQIDIFQEHSQISLQGAYVTDQKQISKLKPLIGQIRQRANYISALLIDKRKLLKQKQIAMQIKRKIKQGQDKLDGLRIDEMNGKDGLENGLQQKKKAIFNQKIQQFLQHYVWKYWNRFDQKMQNITERIIQKIDQYLDMQQPQSFQIDEIQAEVKEEIKTQTDLSQSNKQKQVKFIKQKDDLNSPGKNQPAPQLCTDLV